MKTRSSQNEDLNLAQYLFYAREMQRLVGKLLFSLDIDEKDPEQAQRKLKERGYYHRSENATPEMKLYDKLVVDIANLEKELKKQQEEKNEEKSDRLKSKFNTTRGWTDDILTLCTDGLRFKNQDLITGSTYIAGFNSLWSIRQIYRNPGMAQRKTRLWIDSLKLLIMVVTTVLKKVIETDPTIETLLATIAVLNFLLELCKGIYIANQSEKRLQQVSDEKEEKETELEQMAITDDKDRVTVEKYRQQYAFYYENNKKELQITIFQDKREMIFAAISFAGAVLMPGGTLIWGVAFTGSGIIAGATFLNLLIVD